MTPQSPHDEHTRLLHPDDAARRPSRSTSSLSQYGTAIMESPQALSQTPRMMRRDSLLGSVIEEGPEGEANGSDEDSIDWELEQEGLYRGER